MERKLYYGIATPGAVLTILSGLWMIHLNPTYMHMQWLHIKLSLVLLVILYHFYLGYLLYQFKYDRNKHGHVFYRIINEIPIIFLIVIVVLAVVKPLGMV